MVLDSKRSHLAGDFFVEGKDRPQLDRSVIRPRLQFANRRVLITDPRPTRRFAVVRLDAPLGLVGESLADLVVPVGVCRGPVGLVGNRGDYFSIPMRHNGGRNTKISIE